METWKQINNVPQGYFISDHGRIRYKTRFGNEKIKLGGKNKLGYRLLAIGPKDTYKQYYVHALVLENFSNRPDWAECINHKNGIKDDNRLENLEWSTYKQNNQHAYETGLRKCSRVNSLPEEKVLRIYEMKRMGIKVCDIVREIKAEYGTVKSIYHGKNWKYFYKQHFP